MSQSMQSQTATGTNTDDNVGHSQISDEKNFPQASQSLKFCKPFHYLVHRDEVHKIVGQPTTLSIRHTGTGMLKVVLKEGVEEGQLPLAAEIIKRSDRGQNIVTEFYHSGATMKEGAKGSIAFNGFSILKLKISAIYEVGTGVEVW